MWVKSLSSSLFAGSLGIAAAASVSSCNKAAFGGLTKKNEKSLSPSDHDANGSGKGKAASKLESGSSEDGTQKASVDPKKIIFSGFLTDKDFRVPANVLATSEQDLARQIPENGAFFPSSWVAKDGQECAEIAMDQNLDDALIKVDGNVATVDFDVDASVCNANFGPVSLEWQPGRGVLKVGCMKDLSAFAARPWGAVKAQLISECEDSGEGAVLYNAKVVGVLDLTATGAPIPSQDLTVTVARMSPQNEGCSLKRVDKTIEYGPCRSIIQVQRDNPGVSTYAEVAYSQVSAPQGVNMFTSGSATFNVNGWQGTVNYGANGQSGTWQATDPKKNIKASGTIEPGY